MGCSRPKAYKQHLSKYKIKGDFSFKKHELLENKCNAPTHEGGIYLIYDYTNSQMELLYIGSSGQKKNGKLKVRVSGLGGMKDRLVNGYQSKFGKFKRKDIFSFKMTEENISELKIFWWVTYDEDHSDFPTDIERLIRNEYIKAHGALPRWHK